MKRPAGEEDDPYVVAGLLPVPEEEGAVGADAGLSHVVLRGGDDVRAGLDVDAVPAGRGVVAVDVVVIVGLSAFVDAEGTAAVSATDAGVCVVAGPVEVFVDVLKVAASEFGGLRRVFV